MFLYRILKRLCSVLLSTDKTQHNFAQHTIQLSDFAPLRRVLGLTESLRKGAFWF